MRDSSRLKVEGVTVIHEDSTDGFIVVEVHAEESEAIWIYPQPAPGYVTIGEIEEGIRVLRRAIDIAENNS